MQSPSREVGPLSVSFLKGCRGADQARWAIKVSVDQAPTRGRSFRRATSYIGGSDKL